MNFLALVLSYFCFSLSVRALLLAAQEDRPGPEDPPLQKKCTRRGNVDLSRYSFKITKFLGEARAIQPCESDWMRPLLSLRLNIGRNGRSSASLFPCCLVVGLCSRCFAAGEGPRPELLTKPSTSCANSSCLLIVSQLPMRLDETTLNRGLRRRSCCNR